VYIINRKGEGNLTGSLKGNQGRAGKEKGRVIKN
jgi:hypothetical protein